MHEFHLAKTLRDMVRARCAHGVAAKVCVSLDRDAPFDPEALREAWNLVASDDARDLGALCINQTNDEGASVRLVSITVDADASQTSSTLRTSGEPPNY